MPHRHFPHEKLPPPGQFSVCQLTFILMGCSLLSLYSVYCHCRCLRSIATEPINQHGPHRTAGIEWDEVARLAGDVVGAVRADPEVIGSTTWRGRPPEVGRAAGAHHERPGQPYPRPDRAVLDHVILCGWWRVMRRRRPAYEQPAVVG